MSLTKAMLSFYPMGTEPRVVEEVAPGKRTTKWSNAISSLNAVSNVLDGAEDLLAGLNLQNQNEDFVGTAKTLTFQFNPSTLRISAYGGGLAPIYNYVIEENKSEEQEARNIDNDQNGENQNQNAKKSASQIVYGPVETNITVEFKVIFDAEKNTDAFMVDKLQAIASPAKAAYELYSQDNYSVRQVVEGFLAVIRNQDSRRVVFSWGNLRYTGRMNNVQCNYTMFNPAGEPIRAEVNIRLLASAANDTAEWKKKYTNTLLQYAKDETSNLSNIANNLINLQM